ncbi:MAG: hypothetical protein HC822_23685 [Oscillochloris sp.]|nr:hypothetical protein [Oscillochloris sp.]
MMEEEFDLLPLFNTVAYPLAVTPLAISSPAALRLLDTTDSAPRRLVVIALRNATRRPAEPTLADCYTVGTLALVHRLLRLPDGTLRVAVEGLARVAIQAPVSGPGLRARVALLPDHEVDARPAATLLHHAFVEYGALLPQFSPELVAEIAAEDDPARLSFLAAGPLLNRAPLAERQRFLEQCDPVARLTALHALLEHVVADAPAASIEVDIKNNAPVRPGLAPWLRWSPQGSSLTWVMAAVTPGYARLRVSGMLQGDAQMAVLVALDALRAQHVALQVDATYLRQHDVHVLFADGEPRSDVYGCGGAAALALAGLLGGKSASANGLLLADLDLHGRLLPLPYLPERLAAAAAEGVDTAVIAADQPVPAQNRIAVQVAATLQDALAILLTP